MVRCPYCRSIHTKWIDSDLSCADCDRVVQGRRDDPPDYHAFDDAPSGGQLARLIDEADDVLDAAHAWKIAEITRLDWYMRSVIGATGRRSKCLVTLSILGTFARWLWNLARARSGEADLVIRAARRRATAFGGYRHASAAACTTYPMLGLAGGTTMPAAQPTHAISGGMQFGRMAVAPSHVRRGAARGEDALIDRIDLASAIRAAGLTETDRHLLELVDVGVQRSRARRSRQGIALAVEPLSIADALERMRGTPGLPRTQREAKVRVQRARDAIRGAMRDRGLIPPAERRPVAVPVAAVAPRLPRRASEAFA